MKKLIQLLLAFLLICIASNAQAISIIGNNYTDKDTFTVFDRSRIGTDTEVSLGSGDYTGLIILAITSAHYPVGVTIN